jgi:hypothetical protein
MKRTFSLKLILCAAVLTAVWVEGQALQDSDAQTPSLPPPNTEPGSTSPDNVPTAGTLPPDVDPDSPLAQVIRLVQAGVEPSVILTYITNSTDPFNLNSEEIIYLNDLGAAPEIADAMMQRDQQLQQMGVETKSSAAPPPATTEAAVAPPSEATVNYFYTTLAPYGGWVNLDGYGWCWRPTIVVYNSGWQPYCQNGHWVYSDCGWYWVSGYSWGWATFHYGRWFHHPHYGWCWWPDTTWAPSWVCWRYNPGYCGWAPLPPHAVYQSGVGFIYQGHAVSVGFNFGLNANAFTFVATKDFCDPHPQRHRVPPAETTRVYDQTRVFNHINFDNHRQAMVNAGIPPQTITAATRQAIHPVTILAGNGSPGWSGPRERLDYHGNALIVNRPKFVGSPVLSLHPGKPLVTNPDQNQSQPVVYRNGNNTISHPVTPEQNNQPHQELNQNSYLNLHRTRPRVPQAQQPQIIYAHPSPPQPNTKASTVPPQHYPPWPAQNQTPDRHNNSDRRVVAPRQAGSGQPPRSGATYNSQPRNNTATGQPHSNPTANNHYATPANGAQNNNRSGNHAGTTPPSAQPHASQSSSSSSGNQGQNGNAGHYGH